MDASEDNYLNQFFNVFGELIDMNEDVNLSQLASQDNYPVPDVIDDSPEDVKTLSEYSPCL